MTWRQIQRQFADFRPLPTRTLWKIATTGEVPRKWRSHLGVPDTRPAPVCQDCGDVHVTRRCPARERRPRHRLVAQVSEAEKAAVREAARMAKMTEADFIRAAVRRAAGLPPSERR